MAVVEALQNHTARAPAASTKSMTTTIAANLGLVEKLDEELVGVS
jgi:hypothetical protein